MLIWRIKRSPVKSSTCWSCPYVGHEDVCHWGSSGKTPHILHLQTKWSQVLSFTPWPHCSRGRTPKYPPCVGSRTGLAIATSEISKIVSSCLERNHNSTCNPVGRSTGPFQFIIRIRMDLRKSIRLNKLQFRCCTNVQNTQQLCFFFFF